MKWKQIIPNGCETIYRHGHRAVAANDCIYFFGGGHWKICKQFHGYKIKENLNFLPRYSGKPSPGVACFGMVLIDERIVIFGGMMEYGHYTNDLYILNTSTWIWKKHYFMQEVLPKPRIGHSFTLTDDKRIFVFGGLINDHANPKIKNIPKYMNDLYILHMIEDEKFEWEKLPTAENGPCARESHTTVFHNDVKENLKFLIIFGGMNGDRLGDLWFLNLKDYVWVQYEIFGIPPAPRSLHSASLIGSKMFIFGGWVERQPPKSIFDSPEERFETTNSLSYLDLEELKWVNCEKNNDNCPQSRAGHTGVAVKNRIYVWGGRSNYGSTADDYVCTKDFWYLETEVPPKISSISLINATKTTLEIKWDDIDNAECYLIEIHKIHAVPIDLSKIRIKTINLQKSEQEKTNEQNNKEVKHNLDESEITHNKKIIKEGNEEENNSIEKKNDTDEKKEAVNASGAKTSNENISKTVDKKWLVVGIYKSNSCIVDGFYTFNIDTTTLNYENCPQLRDLNPELKNYLTENTIYAFRIAAINLMGISEWSKMFYFKTIDVEVPSAPSNCKFIPTNQGLRLAWNPNPLKEKVTNYSVYIAIKKNLLRNEFSFLRVFEGKLPTCHIQRSIIDSAVREKSGNQEFIIFRLTANNNTGTSPPLLSTFYL